MGAYLAEVRLMIGASTRKLASTENPGSSRNQITISMTGKKILRGWKNSGLRNLPHTSFQIAARLTNLKLNAASITMTDEKGTDMHINPQRAKQLAKTLGKVTSRITEAAKQRPRPVRLVAVSKLKPANDILALHRPPHSHLHFGENYQQELLQKSLLLPREIRWHFIGALQTNKCRPLAEQIPNLWCVESVDTEKKADLLEKGRSALVEKSPELRDTPLRVFVQVNTSGEEEKSGVEPQDAAGLCSHVLEQCPHLKLQGLMTIGAIARSKGLSEGQENEDFVKLREVRVVVVEALKLDANTLELSMGMSEDFESAIGCGSNEVRVGSTIFGERPPKKEAQIME